jgi:hypothetical protein
MEMITEPDWYSPGIDSIGNYIDRTPSFASIKHGLRCPCGSRRDKVYETTSIFTQHTKTKAHQKWLELLNLNRANYYVENQELKQTVQQQRLIIAKYEKDLQTKSMTIDILTQQLVGKQPTINNLLEFD